MDDSRDNSDFNLDLQISESDNETDYKPEADYMDYKKESNNEENNDEIDDKNKIKLDLTLMNQNTMPKNDINEKIEIRNYQIEIFRKSIEKNVIIYLETGTGKTLIAIMLMFYYLRKYQKSKKICFLADTLHLIEQQKANILQYINQGNSLFSEYIETNNSSLNILDNDKYNVVSLHSQSKYHFRFKKEDFKSTDVYVMTSDTFLNYLRRGYMSLNDFGCIIFDECHHAQKNHSYARIMQEFYHIQNKENHKNRPFIVGLTASPLMSDPKQAEFQKLKEKLMSLQAILDSKFVQFDSTDIEDNQNVIIELYSNDDFVQKYFTEKENILEIIESDASLESLSQSIYRSPVLTSIIDLDKQLSDFTQSLVAEGTKVNPDYNRLIYDIKKTVHNRCLLILFQLGEYALYKMFDIIYQHLKDLPKSLTLSNTERLSIEKINTEYIEKFLRKNSQLNYPNKMSNKFKKLMQILSEKTNNHTNNLVLIYTQRRNLARWLSYFINNIGYKFGLEFKSNFIVGRSSQNSKDQTPGSQIIVKSNKLEEIPKNVDAIDAIGIDILKDPEETKSIDKIKRSYTSFLNTKKSLSDQLETVKEFRQKNFNILVSTSVSEEGFDIPQCNIVVSFDPPMSTRSYVQIKGRARHKLSKYIILAHETRESQISNKIIYFKAEISVLKTLTRENELMKPKPFENPSTFKFKVLPETRACINTNWAKGLLENYCMKNVGCTCFILLPPFMKTHIIEGDLMKTKDEAIESAAYKCCESLINNKLLNDHLYPMESHQSIRYQQLQDSNIIKAARNSPEYEEGLKSLINVTKNDDETPKYLYPLVHTNPFENTYEYEIDENNGQSKIYYGYLYKLVLQDKDGNMKTTGINHNLGFVFFNDSLSEHEELIDSPSEYGLTYKFQLIKKIDFYQDEYESYMSYHRFLECGIRSWDSKFYEDLSKCEIFGTKRVGLKKNIKNLKFSNIFNEKGQPKFAFFVVLNKDNEICINFLTSICEYILMMKEYHKTVNTALKSIEESDNQKIAQQQCKQKLQALHKKYESFRKNSENWVNVQNYINLHKFQVDKRKSLDEVDLYDSNPNPDNPLILNERSMSLHYRGFFLIENVMGHTIAYNQTIFYSRSLRQMILKKLKLNRLNYQERKIYQMYNGYDLEYYEYPVSEEIQLNLKRANWMQHNLRDTLRVFEFKKKLINIEKALNERTVPRRSEMILKKSIIYEDASQFSRFLEDNKRVQLLTDQLFDLPKPKDEIDKDWVYIDEIQRRRNPVSFYSEKLDIYLLKSALSLRLYDQKNNYERLEMFGDTILKLLTTLQILSEFKNYGEGVLSVQRAKIINNWNLFRTSVIYKFYENFLVQKAELYPISLEIDGRYEYPKNLPFQGNNTKEEKSIPLDHTYMPYKNLADLIEAITAVYYFSTQTLEASQKFLRMIGILKSPSIYYDIKYIGNDPTFDNNLLARFNILEELIGYKFKNKSLLIQAFTHISYRIIINEYLCVKNEISSEIYSIYSTMTDTKEANVITKDVAKVEDIAFNKSGMYKQNALIEAINPTDIAYERLEFLGDAIIDFFALEYIYFSYPNSQPGELTMMKISLTSNTTLSLLSIKNGFSKFLLNFLPNFNKITSEIASKFYQYLKDITSYVEEINASYIKITADIFEALIGAIYIDSGQSIGKVKDILRRLYGHHLQELTAEEYLKHSPKYLLEKHCEKVGIGKPIVREIEDNKFYDKGPYLYALEIDGEIVEELYCDHTDLDIIEKKLYGRVYNRMKKDKK